MKKIKILFAAAIFCATAFVGYYAYDQATMTDQERLIQANLEALMNGESSTYDNWVDYYVECTSCRTDAKSCLWSYVGEGYKCTPTACGCGKSKGAYMTSVR